MDSLVIVESPAKAKTISKYLGPGYEVRASMGHVRDLPKSRIGVAIDNGFEPHYVTIRDRSKVIKALKEAARACNGVLLATDPDREGEAISWHLAHVLDLRPEERCRIQFHEITEAAIKRALQAPRPIDMALVNAQQARRVLDRLVGYSLSPLLWRKVRRGLSAGRVQSVALRLICDREREIKEFQKEEYWVITALLAVAPDAQPFQARLATVDGRKASLANSDDAHRVVDSLKGERFIVSSVVRKQRRRAPAPPFTTSTLQQEASRRLGFTARRTMLAAQQLYEGLPLGKEGPTGLVTYIRTDSVRVAAEAQQGAARYIAERWGRAFLPPRPPVYRAKAVSQDAHEAIRPTSVARDPESIRRFLTSDQYRLYRLIWDRFIASQMAQAVLDVVTADIGAGRCVFRAQGSTVVFPGFTVVYVEKRDEEAPEGTVGAGMETQQRNRPGAPDGGPADSGSGSEQRRGEDTTVQDEQPLPPLTEGQELTVVRIEPSQRFTQPPPRFTEASLVKTLEEQGIGRPSTYAPIIETILKRNYVVLEDRKFVPTELGRVVVELLKERFPDVVDTGFTARVEEQLDEIAAGRLGWRDVVGSFYEPFARHVDAAMKDVARVKVTPEETGEKCPQCGRNLVVRFGRYGRFLACPGYPECKFAKKITRQTGLTCPLCGAEVVERKTRKGRGFLGCSAYPNCKFAAWGRPLKETCPRCGSFMVLGKSAGRAATPTHQGADQPAEQPAGSGSGSTGRKGPSRMCVNPACGYIAPPVRQTDARL